jgi:hypothetical protein
MNRLALQQSRQGRFDESLVYNSYTFGDPATPVKRTYLGDPVKERVLHGGSEVYHVHHVHGGATRWRRQPGAEPTNLARGLDKKPLLRPKASERTDSQAAGRPRPSTSSTSAGPAAVSRGRATTSSTATSAITTSPACGCSGASTTPPGHR